jgi:hypothetical protein
VEAAARLDGRADDDELGAMLGRDASRILAEAPWSRPHDPAPNADAVGVRYGRRRLEPAPQLHQLAVELRVERQLARHDERRDEHDPRAAVGGEPAGQVERVLRLRQVEKRDDDPAWPREPHRSNW